VIGTFTAKDMADASPQQVVFAAGLCCQPAEYELHKTRTIGHQLLFAG